VVVAYDRRDLPPAFNLGQNTFTDHGVALHFQVLLYGQRTRLFDQTRRQPDLANVVHLPAVMGELLIVF
jgi:hypothetical protein